MSCAAPSRTSPPQQDVRLASQPAIGFIIDSVGSYSRKARANFEFRSGEIGISASIDPFARGFAILNGNADGFEVEEAGISPPRCPTT